MQDARKVLTFPGPGMNVEPIEISKLPTVSLPQWHRGPIFSGVVPPRKVNVNHLAREVYMYTGKLRGNPGLTIHRVLEGLVDSFGMEKDPQSTPIVYKLGRRDRLHGHLGNREIQWLEVIWRSLPRAITNWAKGRRLVGLAGALHHCDGYLCVPCLDCRSSGLTPEKDWVRMDDRWTEDTFGLHLSPGV